MVIQYDGRCMTYQASRWFDREMIHVGLVDKREALSATDIHEEKKLISNDRYTCFSQYYTAETQKITRS